MTDGGLRITPTRRELLRGAVRTLSRVWRSAPAHLLGYLAAALVGSAAPVMVALLTRAVLDHVAQHRTGSLLRLALAITVVTTAVAVASHAAQYLRAEVDRRTAAYAKDELFAAVSRSTGLAGFENPAFLDRLRLAQQSASHPGRLVDTTVSAASGLVTVVGFVGSLALISPAFTVLVLLAAVPALLIEMRLSRRRTAMLWRIGPAERREAFYAQLMSTASAAKEIRLFALGDFLRLRMLAELRTANAARRRVDRQELLIQSGLAAASAGVAGAGLVWAILAAGDGRLGIGDVSMFVAAIAGVQGALNVMVAAGVMAYEHLLNFQHEVSIVTAGPDLPLPEADRDLPPLRRGIELRDVWFRYSDDHPWILRGVDLFVPHGQTVALVGRNGAGKSTLAKLLCRFYDPTRGAILWDGVDIRDVPPQALRDRISAVFQDFVSYELTAAENIAVGDLALAGDEERIARAAREADVHDTVTALPHGYRTLLSRGFASEQDEEADGVLLSGGQWQRLALARGFLRRDRDLMILDEPSSGLDPEAEYEVHRQLRKLRAGRTSVMISHRLGAIRDVDRIVVLADGVVAEEGGHTALLAGGGVYARLFTRQAAGYRDDDMEPTGTLQ
ncbi:ABC transporter ATP-binding protein [Actinacidiphila bryophytorum]|uniref:ABC transporter ATP-binding protein n=1 Tax=Actinacidiphila bryophytorum TaxID=1436133 RepID=UPI002176A2C9|nr:ABC transporter ATP-binding protein [Actinacidiphila bryophytorum]UWE09715.1 ABC transporter ATP-binding protein/permease [Actinacidiphila bryophytorum]